MTDPQSDPSGLRAPAGLWSRRQIDATKDRVRRRLAQFAAEGREGLHQHLMESLNNPGDDLLEHFVYLVSALTYQIRFRDLSKAQVRRIVDTGLGLLKLQGIKPGQSKLSFLYGEVHTALSQIARGEGRHLASAWHQQLAHQSTRGPMSGGASFQLFVAGNRALRLGHGDMALGLYQKASAAGAEANLQQRIQLQRLKCLRLQGRFEEFDSLHQQVEFQEQRYHEEAGWEKLCRHLAMGGGWREFLQAVAKRGSHHQPIYILEAFLWVKSSSTDKPTRDLVKVSSLARKLSRKESGGVLNLAETLDQLYDDQVPFDRRLLRLGDFLDNINQLEAVEYELMAWLSAARWLSRHNSFPLAQIALCEYRSLGQRLTGGHHGDSLGLAGDLFAKPWFAPMG